MKKKKKFLIDEEDLLGLKSARSHFQEARFPARICVYQDRFEIDEIEEGTEFPVDARQLHQWLGVGKMFTHWIKDRIQKYEFVEGTDFIVQDGLPNLAIQVSHGGARTPRKDYLITLDMAKELAMVDNSDKGRQARKYFIEAEKRLREASKPMSQLELLVASAQHLLDMERRQSELTSVVYQLSDSVQEIRVLVSNEEHFVTVAGFFNLLGQRVSTDNARKVGVDAAKISKERGVEIATSPSSKWGKVNAYRKDILEEVTGLSLNN